MRAPTTCTAAGNAAGGKSRTVESRVPARTFNETERTYTVLVLGIVAPVASDVSAGAKTVLVLGSAATTIVTAPGASVGAKSEPAFEMLGTVTTTAPAPSEAGKSWAVDSRVAVSMSTEPVASDGAKTSA
jgi:hypothetical protein